MKGKFSSTSEKMDVLTTKSKIDQQKSVEGFKATLLNVLCDQGLLTSKDVLFPFVQIQRHDVAIVKTQLNDAYFVKRCGSPMHGYDLNLKKEIDFHIAAKKGLFGEIVNANTAELKWVSKDNHYTVFVAYTEHQNLRPFFLDNFKNFEFASKNIAHTLAAIHTVDLQKFDLKFSLVENPVQTFGNITPEILGHSPEPFFELLRWIQSDAEVNTKLRELKDSWTYSTFIHGDMKADNVLVLPVGTKNSTLIVDWELSGIGDPLWDCGSFIGSICHLWLESLKPGIPKEQIADSTSKICSGIQAFLSEYRKLTFSFDESKVFGWAGYWLIQRVVMMMPLNKNFTALDISAIHLAIHLLKDKEFGDILQT